MPRPSPLPRLALSGVLLALGACDFGPLEPAAPFRAGVYAVAVSVDDGCAQVDMPEAPLDCHAGMTLAADGSLVAAWPEVDAATYIVHDGTLPSIGTEPVLRWSTSGTEASTVCDGAAMRWIMSLSNDDDGALSGSLRNTWTGVNACPVTPSMPGMECSTVFSYRYTLEEPCEEPCTLVDASTAPVMGEYDCGLAACECP